MVVDTLRCQNAENHVRFGRHVVFWKATSVSVGELGGSREYERMSRTGVGEGGGQTDVVFGTLRCQNAENHVRFGWGIGMSRTGVGEGGGQTDVVFGISSQNGNREPGIGLGRVWPNERGVWKTTSVSVGELGAGVGNMST